MNFSLVSVVCLQLDRRTIQSLGCVSLEVSKTVSRVCSDEYLWYCLTERLVCAPICLRPGRKWREAYITLERAWDELGDKRVFNPFYLRDGAHDTLALEVLIELGYDPAADDNLALQSASQDGILESLKLLLFHPNVDPAVNWCQALVRLVEEEDIGTLQRLLTDPRMEDVEGWPEVLVSACCLGQIETVKLLLAHPSVDPAAYNENGETPLTASLDANQHEIVKLLLTDPRVKNEMREMLLSRVGSDSDEESD